jgi:hypothetical protein
MDSAAAKPIRNTAASMSQFTRVLLDIVACRNITTPRYH